MVRWSFAPAARGSVGLEFNVNGNKIISSYNKKLGKKTNGEERA
jgi:hypothetical protein